MASQINITVSGVPRGQGPAAGQQSIGVQSIRGSFAWGGAPGSATIVWVNNGAPTMVGRLLEFYIGAHWFTGICKSDTANDSSRGGVREMQFVDLREFLAWDYVYCAFNMPIRRFVNGVWRKRWWHIYPADFNTYTKTFTDAPLPAWQIVAALFSAPTTGSPWSWNLTGNGLFPGGLMNAPVYGFDCLNGVRLDAALNDISERGGLVYTLDPSPGRNYRLVWMRKGYGLIPVLPPFDWPANADDRRYGVALSGNATNIRVLGDRNRYLVMNVPLAPDWNRAWEVFLTPDMLYLDIFENEYNPLTGIRYNAYPDDPEHWMGGQEAAARTNSITLGQYVALRNARSAGSGNVFADWKKFEGRSRMDMPASLYISRLLFRAYVPAVNGIVNRAGRLVPLDSVNILDVMPCRVTYNPVNGAMQADPTLLTDGNGVGIVKAVDFGQDLFSLVKPELLNATFTSVNNRPWSSVPFQIDDSGEGSRFIVFDQPCFTSENFFVPVDNVNVMNAYPTLNPAAAQAALTFELEPYSWWQGTWPNVSRDRVENVSGLCAEFVGWPGNYTEILFATGQTADRQAWVIANSLLLCQYTYVSGGYKLIAKDGSPLGTPLTSIIDRVDVDLSPNGSIEVVDFTTERQRAHFEPERDLERKTLQNSLFSGQAQLQAEARAHQKFAAGIKGMSRDHLDSLVRYMSGQFDDDMPQVKLNPAGATAIPGGATLAVGTPIFGLPQNATAWPIVDTLAAYPPNFDPAVTTVFRGVTVRQGELADPNMPFYVKSTGDTYARVLGPINENDAIGPGAAAAANLAKATTSGVGVALQKISGATVALIKVRLGGGGGGGDHWQTPRRELDPTLAVAKSTWVYISPLAFIVSDGILDLDTGDLVHATPGVWMALEDIPALVTNPTGLPAGVYYNVPQPPVSAALTGSAGNWSGDLDRTGPTLKWKRIERASPC